MSEIIVFKKCANKREFVGFNIFAGKINDDTGFYEFPKLFKTTSSGKVREWMIYSRLIKSSSRAKNIEQNNQISQ